MHISEEEDRRRDELQQLLMELSSSQDVLKEPKDRVHYFVTLESIYYNAYSDNFRHYYSDIFACLTMIENDSDIGSLDVLTQNMAAIKNGYKPKNMDENGELIDISREITKLYDHVNLDISRINYTNRVAGQALSELARTQCIISTLKDKLDEAERIREESNKELHNESENLKNEINNSQKKMQNEYITIFGIFASIVLAFTGGMTFSSSVLENIDKSSIYRIILVICLLGIVLFNVIWMLIKFLCDINGKVTYRKRYVIIVDVALIACILLSIVAYKFQWLERQTVESDNNTQVNISLEI